MRIAIYGYGNIGRGVELAIRANADQELVGVFTRRPPETVKTLTGAPVFAADAITERVGEIDAVILCGGSAILPDGKDYTFWGRGVSQGHSDAIRRIPGVLDARQYTVPIPAALDAVRSGSQPELSARQKHLRECYVVAAEGADKGAIETAIKTMPNYFADYDTTVTFITAEEMRRDHSNLPHGGFVIRTGTTGLDGEHKHTIEYRLTLDSNPEFTSGVLTALARAVVRLNARGETGCKTIFDLPPALLSPLSGEALRAQML